jgi:hypothetical protein
MWKADWGIQDLGGIMIYMAHTPQLLRSFDGRYTELVITYLSDNVAATLYYHERNAEPRILAQVQENLPSFARHPSRQEIMDESLLVTRTVCERILSEAHELYELTHVLKDDQRIDYVSCFLSVPWVQYEYYNHHERFDSPQYLDADAINRRLQDSIPDGYMRVDRHIAPVFANGYTSGIDVILTNSVTTLDFGVSDCFARLYDLEMLYQLLLGELNIQSDKLYVYSVGNTLRACTEATQVVAREHVLVHIHGYSSDVSVVQGGEIVYAGVVNYGYHDFTAALVDAQIAADFESVWSILDMRSRGELHDQPERAISREGKRIITHFEQAIKMHIADHEGLDEPAWIRVPRDWYVLADRSVGRYLAQFVRDADTHRRVFTPLAQFSDSRRNEAHVASLHKALVTYRHEQSGLGMVH